jgi:hypothetical protein
MKLKAVFNNYIASEIEGGMLTQPKYGFFNATYAGSSGTSIDDYFLVTIP